MERGELASRASRGCQCAQYLGGSGGGGVPTLPAAFASNAAYNTRLDSSVNNGRTVANVHPDVIGKFVIEPSSRLHLEVGVVESTVKLFNPTNQQYFTKAGAGVTFAINASLTKNFRVITANFWNDGTGRYIFGAVPNFIVRADGSPSLMHSASTVSGLEATFKNIAPYIYYGGLPDRRTARIAAFRKSLWVHPDAVARRQVRRFTIHGAVCLLRS